MHCWKSLARIGMCWGATCTAIAGMSTTVEASTAGTTTMTRGMVAGMGVVVESTATTITMTTNTGITIDASHVG